MAAKHFRQEGGSGSSQGAGWAEYRSDGTGSGRPPAHMGTGTAGAAAATQGAAGTSATAAPRPSGQAVGMAPAAPRRDVRTASGSTRIPAASRDGYALSPARANATGSRGAAGGPSTAREPSEAGNVASREAVAASYAARNDGHHEHRGSRNAVCAGIIGGVAVVALGLGYALGVRGCSFASLAGTDGVAATDQARADQQEGQTSDSTDVTGQGASDGASSDSDADRQDETQASDASGVAGLLAGLQHAGEDCSLPTDGTEVDVLGGKVLVAYSTDEDADAALARLTAAAAALDEGLAGMQLTDSSTAPDGVSQVPAASTPGSIASGDNGIAYAGVELVALGQGGYVVAVVSVPASGGLSEADEAAVLDAADSYAIDGGAYAFSGLAAQGIAQTKGDAPTLLTGEQIRVRLTRVQATTSSPASGSTSAAATTTSSTSQTLGTRSGSSSTSSSTTTTTGTGTGYGYSGYGYSGSGRGSSGYSGSGYSGYTGSSSGSSSGSSGSTYSSGDGESGYGGSASTDSASGDADSDNG